jgi:formylglycine-generating enzyme required for sulfatase activity/predicted Ser/Thr protein kinase
MKTCPTCHNAYPDDFSLCPHDGAPLTAQAMETEEQVAAGLSRRFRIVRRLGQGGMGTVFLAEQVGVGNRPVALKVLNRKLLDDPDFLLRFQNEAGSTGRIHHPNVVTIYESAQADDGTPYIAMEFLEGESLRQALERRGALPVTEVAEILQQAARGLNAAHRLGIIHRDLKPDNIFLTRGDEGELVVKVVDFGIAKLRESATHTQTGMVLGTPAYMSCEQASGMRSDELDARSDIYSLGVVAYETLSGRVPFHSDTPLGYLRKHMLEEPPPFRAVAQGLGVPPAVESAVMKALAKDRDQRYGSVLEFAQEFAQAAAAGSHLGAQPEPQREAAKPRPQTTVTPVPKTSVAAAVRGTVAAKAIPEIARPSRRKWLVAGSLVFLVAATAGGFWFRSRSGLRTAQRQVESPPAITFTKEQVESPPAIAFSLFALERTLSGDRGEVDTIAFSPDGKLLASGSADIHLRTSENTDWTIKLWDVATGRLRQTLAGHKEVVMAVAFSPDGSLLASGSGDKTIKLWDVTSGTLRQTLSGHHGSVLSVAFSQDGKVLASGSDDQIIKLWGVASGMLRKTLTLSTGRPQFGFVGTAPVAFSPDGRLLALSIGDNTVKFWDLPIGTLGRTLTGHTKGVTSIAFSPDGKVLASASEDGTVKLWDVVSGTVTQTLTGHSTNVETVAISPDGILLASGSDDKTIKLWDVVSGVLKQTLTGHDDIVFSVAFSPNGKLLASGSEDKTIKLWRRKESVTGSTGRETGVEATVSQMVRTRGEVRVNPKDGLKYVWIPPGTFQMGCSPGDSKCDDNEKPPHHGTIMKGFWLGQTEVTVGAYKRFAGATGRQMPPEPIFAPGSRALNPGWGDDAMPIVEVTWDDAQAYCRWTRGRLPTEAEWEYAARAESTTSRYGDLDAIAWYADNSGRQRLDSTKILADHANLVSGLDENGNGMHEVGQKRANRFGLYDMLGNVFNWVNDWFDEKYYESSPSQDPPGLVGGTERILRGGDWEDFPYLVRVSYRSKFDPTIKSSIVGFRCGGEVFAP